MKKFDDFCEMLFQKWLAGTIDLSCFGKHFLISHIPEPYYTLEDGKNILYVLNYNPGYGLDIQTRGRVKEQGYSCFRQVSDDLSVYYKNTLTGNAVKRNDKILNFAHKLGFDGIRCVETFFLHSSKFDKKMFLKKYSAVPIVEEYTRLLTEYLKDKPVLRISAIGSNSRIEKMSASSNDWFNYQNQIMNFNISSAKLIPVTEKAEKITSGIFVAPNKKFVSVMMGSNNLPSLTDVHFDTIISALQG